MDLHILLDQVPQKCIIFFLNIFIKKGYNQIITHYYNEFTG